MTVTTSPSAGGNAVDKGGNAQIPANVDLVDLTVDGVGISVPKGTLVIRAAEQVGIQIPRFCDHPLLDPVGACRQCLVDVATPGPDGSLRPMPKPQASLHDHGQPRACRSRPSTPRRWPTRPSRA